LGVLFFYKTIIADWSATKITIIFSLSSWVAGALMNILPTFWAGKGINICRFTAIGAFCGFCFVLRFCPLLLLICL
jgi:hypothetical protein